MASTRRRTQSPGRRDAYPVGVPGSDTRPQVSTNESGDSRTLRNSRAAKYFVLGATLITVHSVLAAVRTTPVYVLLLTPLLRLVSHDTNQPEQIPPPLLYHQSTPLFRAAEAALTLFMLPAHGGGACQESFRYTCSPQR